MRNLLLFPFPYRDVILGGEETRGYSLHMPYTYPSYRLNSNGKSVPVNVTVIQQNDCEIHITEDKNASYKVDTFHVYCNHAGIWIVRMESEPMGTFGYIEEAVLVQFPDKTKYFTKGEGVFKVTFDKYMHV